MTGWSDCRITHFTVQLDAAWEDVGPFEAVVDRHPYLHCWSCGDRLWHGDTATGVSVFACMACKMVTDERRVS